MLILTRKPQESIIIDGDIKVTFIGYKGNQIKIGIDAPPEVDIVREELYPNLPTGISKFVRLT